MPDRRPYRDNILTARRLRQELTPSEGLLWEELRDRRLDGLKFRRQHPVGPFVLDFYGQELRTAVEIDDGVHIIPAQSARDAARQSLLEEQGIRFIRIAARDIETNLPAVLASLRQALTPQPPLP